MKPFFKIELLKDAVDFLEKLETNSREKIYYNLKKSQYIYDNELFKKLNNEIWEFRTLHKGKAYRLFAFWDKVNDTDTFVIATHGIIKKTQKIPTKEIKRAEEIRIQYLDYKSKNYEHGR